MKKRSEVEQKDNQGFSLVGLLFGVSVITFLAALTLPEWFPAMLRYAQQQEYKAKQAEAKTYIGSMSRAQQAYYLENGSFTSNFPNLGLEILQENENYRYKIMHGIEIGENRYHFMSPDSINGQKGPFQKLNKIVFPPPFLTSDKIVMVTAQPKKSELKSYVGLVFVGVAACIIESTTSGIVWESEKPSITPPNNLKIPFPIDVCKSVEIPAPQGYKKLGK